jgi:hypothetical protein
MPRTKPTQKITLGDRSFEIPERLPMGIIRAQPATFSTLMGALTDPKAKALDVAALMGGPQFNAMLELLHAAIVWQTPGLISMDDFLALVDEMDYVDAFADVARAAGQLMKSRRTAEVGVLGESGSSESATLPVSTG